MVPVLLNQAGKRVLSRFGLGVSISAKSIIIISARQRYWELIFTTIMCFNTRGLLMEQVGKGKVIRDVFLL